MLAGLYANSKTCIVEPLMTRDHTERLFDLFPVTNADGIRTLIINPKKELIPKKYFIPGDISSASFLIAAGLLIPGSSVILRKVSINPTRTAFINILINAGAEITILNKQLDATEPYGDIEVRPLKSFFGQLIISPDIIPQIIDEIPILAVMATNCADGLTLYGAKELRHKECDRITAIVNLTTDSVWNPDPYTEQRLTVLMTTGSRWLLR
jgi:3-phosphoshikimate 1-carboxyvinyltransferase